MKPSSHDTHFDWVVLLEVATNRERLCPWIPNHSSGGSRDLLWIQIWIADLVEIDFVSALDQQSIDPEYLELIERAM